MGDLEKNRVDAPQTFAREERAEAEKRRGCSRTRVFPSADPASTVCPFMRDPNFHPPGPRRNSPRVNSCVTASRVTSRAQRRFPLLHPLQRPAAAVRRADLTWPVHRGSMSDVFSVSPAVHHRCFAHFQLAVPHMTSAPFILDNQL